MSLQRIGRHLLTGRERVRKVFPPKTMAVIEQAITASEAQHAGQIRFAVEAALHGPALRHNQSARERAIDVFSKLRVWDTEHNNGVLIYLLLADRDVEIVVDRGIDARVGQAGWETVCQMMETHFRAGRFEQGVLAGIDAVTTHLAAHFPKDGATGNELPDAPVVL